MKNIIYKIVIITIILIMTLGITVKADTTDSFNANLTVTNTTIKSGEYITLTLEVSDINMGENGINALEGTIKYDTTIFEEIKNADIQSYNNWTTTYNDQNSNLNGKFLTINLSAGIKEDCKILSVKLKAKQAIKETKETIITIEDISSNNGRDLINIGNKSIKVNVEANQKEIEKQTYEMQNKVVQNTDKSYSNINLLAPRIKNIIIILIVIATVVLVIRLKKFRNVK